MIETNHNAKQWGMLCHLAALAGYLVTPIGWIVGPLLVWAIKKDEAPFIDDQGREALNFQINMFVYGVVAGVVCFVLSFVLVGIFLALVLLPALALGQVVLTIIGTIEASKGNYYRYPGVAFRVF